MSENNMYIDKTIIQNQGIEGGEELANRLNRFAHSLTIINGSDDKITLKSIILIVEADGKIYHLLKQIKTARG